jgi:myo-inositol-1(or 4)-monophosphatase
MQAYVERLLEAESLARKAGSIIREAFEQHTVAFETKTSSIDFVTETDRICEEVIVGGIGEAYPQDGIVGEEGTRINPESEFQWHIDPLDGTTNFVRGIPCFCVSIGIAYNDEPTVGCIFDPINDELFAGITGKGASRDGLPLRVRHSDPNSLVIDLDPGHSSYSQNRNIAFLQNADPKKVIMRHCGSAALALAWVADGRTDAMAVTGWNPWDYMAGTVLVREAGGAVIGLNGEEGPTPDGAIAASSKKIAQLIYESSSS